MVKKVILCIVLISLSIVVVLLLMRCQAKSELQSHRTGDARVHYSCADLDGGRSLRICHPVRIPVTPAQSNAIAVAFARMAEVYERDDGEAMLAVMEDIPDVVTNMPDQALALATKPVQSALARRFIHAESLFEFSSRLDFERFGRSNMEAVRCLGNLYLRRGGDCELLFVYDSQTLKQLMRYKDMFHAKNMLDCEQTADKLIADWVDQIESKDGFTRRYMWFQVDLQWPRYHEGKMTIDDLSKSVKSYADGLIRIGYTPKWLLEFDDLTKALK